MMRTLQDYSWLNARADAQNDVAWLLVLDSLIFHAEAEIRWLNHCESPAGPAPSGGCGRRDRAARALPRGTAMSVLELSTLSRVHGTGMTAVPALIEASDRRAGRDGRRQSPSGSSSFWASNAHSDREDRGYEHAADLRETRAEVGLRVTRHDRQGAQQGDEGGDVGQTAHVGAPGSRRTDCAVGPTLDRIGRSRWRFGEPRPAALARPLPSERAGGRRAHRSVDRGRGDCGLAQRCGGRVVVKLGERGVAARGPAGENLLLSADGDSKDTTGAGDSLAAGLLTELVRGHPDLRRVGGSSA